MTEIKVNLVRQIDDSYKIIIGNNILNLLPAQIKKVVNSKKILIITDSNVAKYHLQPVKASLVNEGFKVFTYIFKAGERSKNRKTKEKIEDYMLKNSIDRSSCIIALGGGVTGDLAGFVAATYCRGIPFIQVPTTLLSQVDSSIGGKVAVDTNHAKNMIGAFYQPKLVLIDTEVLKTIPINLRLNGIGEVIKHGIILDSEFFNFIEKNADKIKSYDPKIMKIIIEKNCNIKRSVVEADEKETGLRKILNFGHTLGHAIEALSNYKISHDECVIIGMYYEALCANSIGLLNKNDLDRIISLIKIFLPDIKIPKNIDKEGIIKKTYLDKKVKNGIVKYALPKKIGETKYDITVDEKVIKDVLYKFA
jgi:3-dehydroquinate synthase